MQDLQRESWSGRISAYILFAAIAGAPLPLGSRSPTTVALWCFALGLGLVLASPHKLRGGHVALLGGIGFVAACFGFVLHEQLSSHPWVGDPNPIWGRTSELLGRPIPTSVSIIRGEPFYALGPPLACFLALTLGLIAGTDKQRADQALHVMAWSGIVYVAIGLANMQFDFAAFLGQRRLSPTGQFSSTFVNRNTAAAYFGSCSVVWLVLALSAFRRRLPTGPIVWSKVAERITAEKNARSWELMVCFGGLFACLTAMFLTASRGGVLLSLFAMAVVVVIFFRRDLPSGKGLVLLILGAGAISLTLLQFIGGSVQGRIDASGLSEHGRVAAYQSSLRIIADYPWFGTGLGSFTTVFPAYRSGGVSIWGFWNAAHSTPLELAIELGVPLTLVFAFGWITILLVLLHGTRRSRLETIVPFAALGVSLIALMHSSIDFSLQVSGYAIVVFAFAGVGLAQSLHDSSSGSHQRHRRRSRSRDEKIELADAEVR